MNEYSRYRLDPNGISLPMASMSSSMRRSHKKPSGANDIPVAQLSGLQSNQSNINYQQESGWQGGQSNVDYQQQPGWQSNQSNVNYQRQSGLQSTVSNVDRRERIWGADNVSLGSDRAELYADDDNPNMIVTHAPKERFRLGYFDVVCLVVNRMIGTGIFNSPQRVMQGTNSTGASLLLWFAGIVFCLSGTHVYIEYGLNVPRYLIHGIEQSVPRSGGDLNYLQYVYRQPAYRKDTVLLCACVFGIGFIVFGNMAGNCISFAIRVLQAANVEQTPGAVRGIAIAIAIATCFIHAFSRRGGIWLNNSLAIVKVLMLLCIIITSIVVAAGGIKGVPNRMAENTSSSNAFKGASDDANGYAQAFLAIVFSFSGFEQPNYVMGEISHPRKKHPIAMTIGVTTVCLLYMAVNLAYMVVVPREEQLQPGEGVAERFFELAFGDSNAADGEITTAQRVFYAFLAISSLGNIIVMTYTAARMKQEIAKEGIIPFAKFFAQNRDMSLGRLLNWLKNKGMFRSLLATRWLSPEQHREQTPVGAFILHFFSCLVLVFATWGMDPNKAYTLLANLHAYLINSFFGIFLGLGILILRFKGPPPTDADEKDDAGSNPSDSPRTWRDMTGKRFNPVLSVVCASIYLVGGLWTVVTNWIKPSAALQKTIGLTWYLVPAISWAVIGLGVLWFLGFLAIAWRIHRKTSTVYAVEKKPEFESADGGDDLDANGSGGLVLVHETVYLNWVASETLRERRRDDFGANDEQRRVRNPYGGTDFEEFYQEQQAPDVGGFGTGYRPR